MDIPNHLWNKYHDLALPMLKRTMLYEIKIFYI
jgi:hypothetical protein